MPPPVPQQHRHDKFLYRTANVLVYANSRHLLPQVSAVTSHVYSNDTVTAVTGDTITCLHKYSYRQARSPGQARLLALLRSCSPIITSYLFAPATAVAR